VYVRGRGDEVGSVKSLLNALVRDSFPSSASLSLSLSLSLSVSFKRMTHRRFEEWFVQLRQTAYNTAVAAVVHPELTTQVDEMPMRLLTGTDCLQRRRRRRLLV